MKRILLRSGKSPLDVKTPAASLRLDLMGTNVGNLLFSDSVHKMLDTPGTEVTSNGIRTTRFTDKWVARTNAEYDVFVVPLANAFRPAFHAGLDRLSAAIEQLTIPVVVVGVGAQVGADYDTQVLAPMAESVKRFARTVLDHSATIGVRGELTADYLADLGFHDTEVIGCPSMFRYGGTLPSMRKPEGLDATSRIALNLSPDAVDVGDVPGLVDRVSSHFPELTYFAQDTTDAELLFWGDTSVESGRQDAFPRLLSHPLFQKGKVVVPLDTQTWIGELASHDFAFGTRIHGNIAALLAGTPAVVLAHDSRTLELARYFDIPHRLLADLPNDTGPAELLAEADYSRLVSGHPARFTRVADFLARNDLENTYQHGDAGVAFEARLADLDLPPSLRVWDGSDDGGLRFRISALRERLVREQETSHRLALRVRDLRERLADAEVRLTTVEGRIAGIDRRVMVRLGPAIRRRFRR